MESRLTNAAIEGVNGLLQMSKHIAHGFRVFYYFRLTACLRASALKPDLPHPLPIRTVEDPFLQIL